MVGENSKLTIKRYFTEKGKKPEDYFTWTQSDIEIKDSFGNSIYSGKNLYFPNTWSQLARKVVSSKYFYKGNGPDYLEKDLRQLAPRVINDFAKEGVKQGYFSESDSLRFQDELTYSMMNQSFSWNSPVWFNAGLFNSYGVKEEKEKTSSHWAIVDNEFTNGIDAYERPQLSACFIMSIDDDMSKIMRHATKEAMLFKHGSGTGTNYGPLRGFGEPLSGGGFASGCVPSFMKIYDIIAGSIRSGGKTRRAAKMLILPDDHPDLFRFINWKVEEEKKALWLCANQRWAPRDLKDLESEAYKTVTGQNGNNSIRVTDEFMEAALRGGDWDLWLRTKDRFDKEVEISLDKYHDDRYLTDKRFIKKLTNKRKVINAEETLEQITRAAAVIGDPALQYDSTINKWNTCSNSGRINASNPCSEYMFLDDSACNLASLNLIKFRKEDGSFDIKSFKQVIRNIIISQDIIVDHASYPDKEIARNSHLFRALGLGYTNLGALVMSLGLPYDSDEARALASGITSLMTSYAFQTSAELAEKFGAFKEFEKNKEPMLNVIKMHMDKSLKIKRSEKGLENKIINEANRVWKDDFLKGDQHGFRNSQVTLLAPTGTIGFMMDVDTTGIEGMPALIYEKGLAGGGELEIDLKPCVTSGLKKLGYSGEKLEKIVEYMKEKGSVIDAPYLREEHYKVFETAFGDNVLSVDAHLNMMAAVQPFLSGAISKTVNLPKGSTIQDVRDTYIKGWKLGLKSISLYIDGSKGIQPLNIKTPRDKEGGLKWGDRIKPENPMLKGGFINRVGWNVDIQGTGVHFIIGEYEDRPPKDTPADYFIEFGSSGSDHAASYTSWGKEASRGRQLGGTIKDFIKHNKGASGTVKGLTDHEFIKSCSSIEDMFAKIVQLEYLGETTVCDKEPNEKQIKELRCNVLANRRRVRHYQSRIDFIETAMKDGKLIEIFPLYEDELQIGEISMSDIFCTKCGYKTELSGANCRKCNNCGEAGVCG